MPTSKLLNPPCRLQPRRIEDVLLGFGLMVIGFFLLTLVWHSWWVLLLAAIAGVILVVHPVCLFSHGRIRHKHWWP